MPGEPKPQPAMMRIRCRQTGFTARIPAYQFDQYTDEQKASYEVLDAPAGRSSGKGTADGAVGE